MAWIVGCFWAVVFLLAAIGNLAVALNWLVRKAGSLLPAIGGLSGFGASLTLLSPALRRWFWVPLLVDLGRRI